MTKEEIDNMSIEEIESIACNLTSEQLKKWSNAGYDGETYIKLSLEQPSSCAYSGLSSLKNYE